MGERWQNVAAEVEHFRRWSYIYLRTSLKGAVPNVAPVAMATSVSQTGIVSMGSKMSSSAQLDASFPSNDEIVTNEAKQQLWKWLVTTLNREIKDHHITKWACKELTGLFMNEDWNFQTGLIKAVTESTLTHYIDKTLSIYQPHNNTWNHPVFNYGVCFPTAKDRRVPKNVQLNLWQR